ncbi:MAG TPA: sulfotransferase [Steroidobacteraceae bacterium]|nr:sulfotransferase [Steroidobacteraceae bacterium]
MPALPDFAIIGAPKCGTTSLAAYLGGHPDVFMSPIKEPAYFCDPPALRALAARRHVGDFGTYAGLFAAAEPNQLRGEASASYLFSGMAIERLLSANPEARLIAMVRNPIDMVVSLHASKAYNCLEYDDFATAWRASPKRRVLDYRSLGRLGGQLARLKRLVPERQLHVVVFDDLCADPPAAYRSVLAFLGLPDDGRLAFPVLNGRKARSWPQLARLAKNPPPPLDRLKQALKQAAPGPSRAIGRRLSAINTRPARQAQLSKPLRREMADSFRDDVSLLSELLGRDLRTWLAPT